MNYSFVDVNVDVSYCNSHKFFEVANYPKPDINGSKENIILIFLTVTSSLFHLLKKKKPNVRIKIIHLAILSFIDYSIKHLQPAASYQGINVYCWLHFFTIELISKFQSLCTSQLHLQSIFLSISKTKYHDSNSYYRFLLLLSGYINVDPGPFHNHPQLDHDECDVFKHRGLQLLHLHFQFKQHEIRFKCLYQGQI